MKSLEEKKRDRFIFLKAVYEQTEWNESHYGDFRQVARGLGFEDDYFASSIYQYLMGQGLI